jgi:hypothetical protein
MYFKEGQNISQAILAGTQAYFDDLERREVIRAIKKPNGKGK